MTHTFTPGFELFELVQDTTTGRMFVVTEIKYVAQRNWFGQIRAYEFQYNSISEKKLKRIMTAYDAWEQNVLSDPKLFVPRG